MRLVIGQEIHGLACSVETLIGAVRSGCVNVYLTSFFLCATNLVLKRSQIAVNFLLIESLQRFYQYYGDSLQVRIFDMTFRKDPSLTLSYYAD